VNSCSCNYIFLYHGGAKIIDYAIVSNGIEYPAQIESTAQTDFFIKVHFETSFTDVTVGFLIKTHDGVFLYGTNSFLSSQGKEIISAQEEDVKIFKFSLPMILNSGHYLISFGVSRGSQENLEPLDRRYDAILLNIERPISFGGIVDLQAKFEMENLKNSAMSTFQKVRNFITELRPMMLDDLGLIPTIKRYREMFSEQNGIEINLNVKGVEKRFDRLSAERCASITFLSHFNLDNPTGLPIIDP